MWAKLPNFRCRFVLWGRAPCTSPPCGGRCASGRRWAPSAIGPREPFRLSPRPPDNCNCNSTAKRPTMIFLSSSTTEPYAKLVDATRQKPGDGLRRCTGRRPPLRNGETPKGDLGEILLDANCLVPCCSMQCKRGSAWTTTRLHCTGGGRGDRAHGSGRQRHNGARKTNSTKRAIRNIPTADEQTATDNKKAGFRWGWRTLCRRIGNGLM